MRLLIDENVPERVAEVLAARGHEVLYSRIEELLPTIETLFELAQSRQRQFIILVKHTGIELIDNAVRH